MLVPNDDTVEPFSTSQFQPPSGSCSPRSRSTSGVMSIPKYAPVETTLPLMHGSTSPSKNPLSFHGGFHQAPSPQVTWSRTRPIAAGLPLVGSRPSRRRSSRTWKVSVRSCENALPAHSPSGAWSASSRAPQPSTATRARSAATTSAGSRVRSRITCQRIAGSASSSQSMTATAVPTLGAATHPDGAVRQDGQMRPNTLLSGSSR